MALNKNVILIVVLVFFLSSCTYDDGYRIEGNKVFYEMPWNAGHGTRIFETDAAAKTFEVLGSNNLLWAKDKDYVFLRGSKLDFLNPKTFVVLNDLFGKDDKTVACDYKPILEADIKTFYLKEFTDRTGGKTLLGVDKNATYECSDGDYFRMPSEDIENFELLYGAFYRDKKDVYWSDEKLPLDVLTLKLLDGEYIADDKQVFYADRPVIGADLETFKVISERRAKDKNYVYESESKVKSISGIEQLLSVEVWNEIDNMVKKPKQLKSGEIVQVWGRKDVKINNVKVKYKDQLIYRKVYDNGGLGARSVVHGIIVDKPVKLDEISSLTFAWTGQSGDEREVSVDVTGIIPKNYNGGVLRFKVIDSNQVTAKFEKSK